LPKRNQGKKGKKEEKRRPHKTGSEINRSNKLIRNRQGMQQGEDASSSESFPSLSNSAGKAGARW
jgi:hypothetical protein